MRREGCAEEDDEEEDGGDGESDGQDEGQEGGLCVWSVNAHELLRFLRSYHSSSSKVLSWLGLLLPLLLRRRRCLAGRRKAEEAVKHLDDDNQRREFCERGDRILHKAIEAQ